MFGGSPTSAVTTATKPVTSGGMSGLARFGVRTGVKLGVGAAAGIAKSLTAAPKPPQLNQRLLLLVEDQLLHQVVQDQVDLI